MSLLNASLDVSKKNGKRWKHFISFHVEAGSMPIVAPFFPLERFCDWNGSVGTGRFRGSWGDFVKFYECFEKTRNAN